MRANEFINELRILKPVSKDSVVQQNFNYLIALIRKFQKKQNRKLINSEILMKGLEKPKNYSQSTEDEVDMDELKKEIEADHVGMAPRDRS